MTLAEIIKIIEDVAKCQPSINMIVENDVFKINTISDARYGIFAFVQGTHQEDIDNSTINYKFSFIYLDRLQETLKNQIDIQSTGISTLSNIIKTIDMRLNEISVSQVDFQPFNQRFLDECAGVFCNISFLCPTEPCSNEYETKNIKIL